MIDIVERARELGEPTTTTGQLWLDLADEIERLRLESAGSNQLVKAGETIDRQAKEIERLKAELAETIAAFPLGAVKAERDRCAKVAEEFPTADTYDLARGRHEIAAAIRGRVGNE